MEIPENNNSSIRQDVLATKKATFFLIDYVTHRAATINRKIG